MYDVFVSYRHSDVEIVRYLVLALERLGLHVWFDEKSIPDFAGITNEARDGLADSKAILCYYSSAYPDSSPCQWELTAAFLCSARLGDPRQRVLVVNPESGPDHIEPVELRDALYQSARGVDQAGIEEIAGKVASHLEQIEGPLGHWNLVPTSWHPAQPSGATRFVGRWPEMWRIHSSLHAHRASLTQGVVGPGVAQIRGLGGIGKSLLAREYALRFSASFPGGVFWLYAQGDLSVRSSEAERESLRLGQLRGFATSVLGPERAAGLSALSPEDVEAVLRNALATAEPCLWVVDDLPEGLGVAEVHRWIGPASACTLITTRSAEYSSFLAEVHLGALEPQEALQMLTGRRSPVDEEEWSAARAVVAELGGHALAVDVAGGTLRFQSFTELLEHLRDPTEDELELAAELQEELPTGRERSITATLSQSLDRLGENGQDLLRLAAMLARDPISRRLFDLVFEIADDLTPAAARSKTLRALNQVLALSLIEPAQSDSWQIHPLLARTVELKEANSERRTLLHGAAVEVFQRMLASEVTDPTTRDAIRRVIDHARRLTQQLKLAEEADLLGQIAAYDFALGDYAAAKSGYERQMNARAERFGALDPSTLDAMSAFGAALRESGDLPTARAVTDELVDARRRVFGPDDANTLSAMADLAHILREAGELHAARALEEVVLASLSQTFGQSAVETLSAKSELAETLWALGDFPNALALANEVFAGRQEMLGRSHPDTLYSMGFLATTLWTSGKLHEARELEEAVLASRDQQLGPHHPDTLEAMGNLAVTLSSLGDLNAAVILQREVVEVQIDHFGPNHPTTLTNMYNLAGSLRRMGDLSAARELGEKVLASRQIVLGPQHHLTLLSKNGLAQTLLMAGELMTAEVLASETLAQCREVLGERHPFTLVTMSNIAEIFKALGEMTRARETEEQVVSALRDVLSPEDWRTLEATNNLGETLRMIGDVEASRSLGEETLAQCRNILGDNHPLTLAAMNNHASTLRALGDLGGARSLGEGALAQCRNILGDNHPLTLAAMNDLASYPASES